MPCPATPLALKTGALRRATAEWAARVGVTWLLIGVAGLLAATAAPADPVGTWITEDGAGHIAITPCAERLCGKLTWLEDPLDADGKPVTDRNNPDPALHDRPVLGLTILTDLAPTRRRNVWDGGTIYDPQTGNTYRVRLTLTDPRTLQVRGYIGTPMLGRTTTWRRVEAAAR
jgi:uncharacterized protein (DUF2147 family)